MKESHSFECGFRSLDNTATMATQIVSRANFLKNHHVEGQNIDFFLTDLADFSME
jgi:uncharacterized protein YcbK (DUF882 family)